MWHLQECEPRLVESKSELEPGTTVSDLGKGRMVVDVDRMDFRGGQLVVSTTTTTRIRKILGL